jgi:VIT1/CCC1 family predicted Fe2+/Mn2+ transporter
VRLSAVEGSNFTESLISADLHLALLATAPFNTVLAQRMSENFGKAIFENFNTLVGVMVGFYFGGKAAEKAAEAISRARNR